MKAASLLQVVCLLFLVLESSWGALPRLLTVPASLPADVKLELDLRHAVLERQHTALLKLAADFARDCTGRNLKKDSPEAVACVAQQVKVQDAKVAYVNAVNQYSVDVITNGMNALAIRLGWTKEKQVRLNQALNKLGSDGDPRATDTQIRRAWRDVLARKEDGDFAREASRGDGPGLSGAGKQTIHEDCAVFALANAASLPYGVVAARATELLRTGEWREAAERANPQKVIEEQGLKGGEVVMLAEAFGQVEIVPSSDFAKTLKAGRPVMIGVVPENGDVAAGHEVVLTKTFQYRGETWFEMMDSNQGPQRRLYLSTQELSTMLQENGVAFRPEPGATPKLLRTGGK